MTSVTERPEWNASPRSPVSRAWSWISGFWAWFHTRLDGRRFADPLAKIPMFLAFAGMVWVAEAIVWPLFPDYATWHSVYKGFELVGFFGITLDAWLHKFGMRLRFTPK